MGVSSWKLRGRLVEDTSTELQQLYNRIPSRENANNEYRLQVFSVCACDDVLLDVFVLRDSPLGVHPASRRSDLPLAHLGGPQGTRLRSLHRPASELLRRRHRSRAELSLQRAAPLVHRRRASRHPSAPPTLHSRGEERSHEARQAAADGGAAEPVQNGPRDRFLPHQRRLQQPRGLSPRSRPAVDDWGNVETRSNEYNAVVLAGLREPQQREAALQVRIERVWDAL